MSPALSLRNLCRTCMTNTDIENEESARVAKFIYETPTEDYQGSGSNTIMELLLMVEPQIKIDLDDDLPKTMCFTCIEQLQISCAFLETYKESNEKFLKLLKEAELLENAETEFQHIIECCDTEKEHLEVVAVDEDDDHQYEIEIEKFPENKTKKDSEKEVMEMTTNLQDWPEYDEEPICEASDGEENRTEYFNNEYSDPSGNEWTTNDVKSNKRLITKLSSKNRSKRCKKKFKSKVHVDINNDSSDEEIQPPENEDGSVSCLECEAVLENAAIWQTHMRQHRQGNLDQPKERSKAGRPKKSYDCEYCGKVFPKTAAYKNHVRIHTGEEPYLCIECGKSFKVVSSLNTHMLRHRGDKKIQCPHCPKKFVCSSGLYGHMMVHNKDDKPYVCDICGSAFHMAYMLRKHNLYHKGIKNFPCEYCDLRFVTAEKQRRHMRTHTGEKPYKCPYCDRAFAQSNDRNKHLKQHLGDNIYQCELCPLRFPLARDLRVHFATHKDDDEETRKRNLEARMMEENNIKIKLGAKVC